MQMSASQPPSEIDIEPAALAAMLEHDSSVPPQLIDVREPYERDAGHIAGSQHIELTELSERADAVERERPVVFYCRLGRAR